MQTVSTHVSQYHPADVQQDLDDWAIEMSGHDAEHTYLGMSQIHREEDKLLAILQGKGWQPRPHHHLMFRLGYLMETEVLHRLWEKGMLPDEVWENDFDCEVQADFDSRFRGHIDGYLHDGSLVEVKSTVQAKLDRIIKSRNIPREHFEQVQMYMHHGQFERAIVIYIARDTGATWVRALSPVPAAINNLNAKARRVLQRFDSDGASRELL